MFDAFATADGWVALLTLTALETILGIDNVVFIAILTAKLPKDQQKTAYRLGLLGAMLSRIALRDGATMRCATRVLQDVEVEPRATLLSNTAPSSEPRWLTKWSVTRSPS